MPRLKRSFAPHLEGFRQLVVDVVAGLGQGAGSPTAMRNKAAEQLDPIFRVNKETIARSLHKYSVDKQGPTLDVVRKLLIAVHKYGIYRGREIPAAVEDLIEYVDQHGTRERAIKLKPFVGKVLKETYVRDACPRYVAIAAVARAFAETLRMIEDGELNEPCKEVSQLALTIELQANAWQESFYIAWLTEDRLALDQQAHDELLEHDRQFPVEYEDDVGPLPKTGKPRRVRLFGPKVTAPVSPDSVSESDAAISGMVNQSGNTLAD